MEVLYRSTRGNEEGVSASKAILEGLASDGGLFVPQALPSFDKTLDEFAQMDYRQTAYEVMKLADGFYRGRASLLHRQGVRR